jgi:effector-binding domain-containing protein
MPTPFSNDVKISTQQERDVAVIRFYGLMSEKKREKYLDTLLDILGKRGIQTKGSAFILNYSDPFVPPPLRINEIGIEVLS